VVLCRKLLITKPNVSFDDTEVKVSYQSVIQCTVTKGIALFGRFTADTALRLSLYFGNIRNALGRHRLAAGTVRIGGARILRMAVEYRRAIGELHKIVLVQVFGCRPQFRTRWV